MRPVLICLVERLLGIERARAAIIAAWCAVRSTERPAHRIQVTKHARGRMLQRLGCRQDKIEKVARKAWTSRQMSRYARRKATNARHMHIRFFSGCVFIYGKRRNSIRLVTVIRPGAE